MELQTVKIPKSDKKDLKMRVIILLIKLEKYTIDYNYISRELCKLKEHLEISKMAQKLIIQENDNCKSNLGLFQTESFKQNLNLESSQRSMIEMECVSLNINENLIRNNDNLLNTSSKVSKLNREIQTGTIIIKRIFNKENQNKLIIVGFSTILLIIFLYFIIYKCKIVS